MGFPVNFVYTHTEVITKIAVVLVPAFFLGMMMLLAGGKTKEVSELKGWENSAALITKIDFASHSGEFEEGQRVGRVDDGEFKGEFIADGKGGYFKAETEATKHISTEELEKILKGEE